MLAKHYVYPRYSWQEASASKHWPRFLASIAAKCGSALQIPAPFATEQLEILTSGSVLSTEDNPLLRVFFVKPLPFGDAVADYLEGDA